MASRMSSVLYLLFEKSAAGGGSLAREVKGTEVAGYSFSEEPLKKMIRAPGEPDMPVRCLFYAQNYFRVFVSDLAVEFHRDSTPPPELVTAEGLLRSRILEITGFRLRRWVATSEGWDDDDKPFVRVLSEGTRRETLIAEPCASPNGGPSKPLANSAGSEGPPSLT